MDARQLAAVVKRYFAGNLEDAFADSDVRGKSSEGICRGHNSGRRAVSRGDGQSFQ
jgi:hypothetical protein